ncbi:type I 3-dehydroquinate dehydratase [Pendulispora brunnea]|uniref:Type I 3-dehydroquinate dehydratase n=1 Tax=Pendulispora brunnea TaxID=2905690 RepID=A0ABZ2KHD3_9BACT
MNHLSRPERSILHGEWPFAPTETATRKCTVVTTLTSKPRVHGYDLPMVGDIEVRADLLDDIDPALLRARSTGKLTFSLRSVSNGGAFGGDARERARRLVAALEHYDVVDLEADRDLLPKLLLRIPPHRRRISWHGSVRDIQELAQQFERMAGTPALLYLLAPDLRSAEQALIPLRLLKQLRRSDVTAFGTAPAGIWSRLLAPRLGAPIAYGRLRTNEDSVPTVEQLTSDYRLPTLPPLKRLFAIVGKSPGASMSPRLHNAGYRAAGLPALYVPMAVDDFSLFWPKIADGLRELGFSLDGITVVSPHKEAALAAADRASGMAARAGAANILVRTNEGWIADTTNPSGLIGALRRAGVRIGGRRAAVIGCGGAGRAAAAALMRARLRPDMVNRGADRGHYAARLLGLSYVPLKEFAPEGYSLIVHATPLREETPFGIERLARGAIFVDMGYGLEETASVAAARADAHEKGLVVIDGWTVLSADAAQQFHRMTGQRMPIRDARVVLNRERKEPWKPV